MSKLLEEASLVELEQAIKELRYREHGPRINEIYALYEELTCLKDRRSAIFTRINDLKFSSEECPNKDTHTNDAHSEPCFLCDGNWFVR